MIRDINERPSSSKIEIDLTGPEGNAFVLIAYAKKIARQLKWEEDKINWLVEEMKSKDYEYLIELFDKFFGDYVILWR